MKRQVASPAEWLTDSGLTPAGKIARESYSNFVKYLETLPIPTFRKARALHLLQSNSYDTVAEGFALPPHTVNFSLNNTCNLKCEYCDLNRGQNEWEETSTKVEYSVIDPNERRELPLEKCKNLIDQVEWFRPIIRAHWMESLLYSDLIPFIEYARSKDLPVSMLTNGLLLKKFAPSLVESGVEHLRVSLDGPAHIHDALCGVPGAYDTIVEGLQLLVEENKKLKEPMQIGGYFTITDKNYNEMNALVADLDKKGLLEHMYLGFFMFSFISKDMVNAHNQEHAAVCGATVEETSSQYVDVTKIDMATLLQQKKLIEDKYISKGARINFRPNFTEENLSYSLSTKSIPLPNVRCETHWHSLCVNPAGQIKPMSQCILDPCGDVFEESLLDIWNGEELRDQRVKLHEHGAYHGCMRCWSVYSSIEDAQGSWISNVDEKA